MPLPLLQASTIEQMVDHCLNPLTEAQHLRAIRFAIGLVQLGYRFDSPVWQELDDLRTILAAELDNRAE
ncbi:MAG TPA: hypothetical protein PKV98_07800 [Burkholderiaceae bacterium]|nr:hypothetical protein [Burkholderiaceae bacterium]